MTIALRTTADNDAAESDEVLPVPTRDITKPITKHESDEIMPSPSRRIIRLMIEENTNDDRTETYYVSSYGISAATAIIMITSC